MCPPETIIEMKGGSGTFIALFARDVREDVALEMVDADERHAPALRERLRGHDADEQRAHEPRPRRYGDEVYFIARRENPRFVENLGEERQYRLLVHARGELRNDAAVDAVRVYLAGNRVRDYAPSVNRDGERRVVAA